MAHPTSDSAYGIWSLNEVRDAVRGENWPEAAITDPNFANVSLLINADDLADGSTAFVDESNNSHTITANGDAQVDTAVFKYGTGSVELDGTGDYLSIASDASFGFGTGDFTMECWIYPLSVPTTYVGLMSTLASTPAVGVSLCTDGSGNITFSINSASASTFTANTTSTKYAANTWQHIAIARESGTVKIWLDGSQLEQIKQTRETAEQQMML